MPFDGAILPTRVFLQERGHEPSFWSSSLVVDVFEAKRVGDHPWLQQQDKRSLLGGIERT